jgi:hypothetical protein
MVMFSCAWRQAASVASSIGSTIEASSFSGLLTRVDIGHIRNSSAGNGRIRSLGSVQEADSAHPRGTGELRT